MSSFKDNAVEERIGIYKFASNQRVQSFKERVVFLNWTQVGYAEKMGNVWAKVAEETSQYDREKQSS